MVWLLAFILLSSATVFGGSITKVTKKKYIVIAWNDLGMHCISPTFAEMAILPPYNTLVAQVIKRGNPPRVVTRGVTLSYRIVNNRTVTGKTDFWTYAEQLFGVALPEGTGLTGNGLFGTMVRSGKRFEATGIPVLPYNDNMIWNPYQIAVVTAKDSRGRTLDSTEIVIPVSDEMNCAKCHAYGKVAAVDINTGTIAGNILTLHDQSEGTSLMASRPVLCAGCHSDNALGTPGEQGVPSLSKAMHTKHASISSQPACYDCHPGSYTRCNRSAIESMGPSGSDPQCENCHGSLSQMADTLNKGRQPWLQEPNCVKCHDSSYSTGQNLYRNSSGHGHVACAACHNSPHAWWPSLKRADNRQPIRLQRKAGPIEKCIVCHKNSPGGDDPHRY